MIFFNLADGGKQSVLGKPLLWQHALGSIIERDHGSAGASSRKYVRQRNGLLALAVEYVNRAIPLAPYLGNAAEHRKRYGELKQHPMEAA